jgi:hypothetical protein
LLIVSAWGLYGVVYFVRNSKKQGKTALLKQHPDLAAKPAMAATN